METQPQTASARAYSLPISRKHAVEIGNFIRSKPLAKAKLHLLRVSKLKEAVPALRFKRDRPHRKGHMATGIYPIKASTYVLHLLESAEKNAQQKGLDVSSLIVSYYSADKGETRYHYGRRHRAMRRTHVTVEVTAVALKKKQAPSKKGDQKP